MLLALLYQSDDRIAAAAAACDQQPLGDRYWSDCQGVDLKTIAESETAYVAIEDPDLCQQLLQMETGHGYTDGFRAAADVERYIQRSSLLERIAPSRAA